MTLLERKILGLCQLRRGPNKVANWGLLQPFRDAIKLFIKEGFNPRHSNVWLFISAPALALILTLWIWRSSPSAFSRGQLLNGLLIVALLGLGVYSLFLAGWASNSKFAQLGAIRAIAQTISYEIRLALIIFRIFISHTSLTVSQRESYRSGDWGLGLPLLGVWLVRCVAETNRTPFDFAEGESELVSGFNIEYGGAIFAILFMAEYGMILFFSSLTVRFFLKTFAGRMRWEIIRIILASFWVWLRARFPRYRYDKLLNLAWKSLLPFSLALTLFYMTWVLFSL